MPLITDEARAWAERAYPDAVFVVGRNDIERYAYAIGEHDPIHHDPASARAAGYSDIVAPPLFPYVIRMHTAHLAPRDDLAPDGSATADVPPVETTRAMAGEISLELGADVVAGDTVTVKKRIVEMYEKEGRSGALLFVTMEFEFVNQRDELIARERFTRIYR